MKIPYDNARKMSLICPSISASSSLIPANEDISQNDSRKSPRPLKISNISQTSKSPNYRQNQRNADPLTISNQNQDFNNQLSSAAKPNNTAPSSPIWSLR